MIIFLNQVIKFSWLLPKSKFSYFSTNPELSNSLKLNYNFVNLQLDDFKDYNYYDQIIIYQKQLEKFNLDSNFNPNTLTHYSNFKKTKDAYYTFLSKKLEKYYNDKVVFPAEIWKHKSVKVFIFYYLNELNFRPLINLFISFPSLLFSIKYLFSDITIVLSNENQFNFIKKNFDNHNHVHLSKKFWKKNKLNLESIFFLYKYLFFGLNYLKFLSLKRLWKNYKDFTLIPINILFNNYCLNNFSFAVRKYFIKRVISVSNYGFSEALLNFGNKDNNILINHGAHYYDKNKLINSLWMFHARTIIKSSNVVLYSSNNKDYEFLLKNNFKIKFNKVDSTIRDKYQKVKKIHSKKIIIADTFKDDDSLRPYLYHEVNQYVYFLEAIHKTIPKEHEIIVRHRDNSILTKSFLRKIIPGVKFSKNKILADDFTDDPILISYSSTTLLEAQEAGLRIISFDCFNKGLNFLNFERFNKDLKFNKRFNVTIRGEAELHNFFTKYNYFLE